jgi:TDG/mug DNA glycosylase family protein
MGDSQARSKPLPDVIAPGLALLFCGINPSLLSAERGHHFARPGNRFWPALHAAGITPRRLSPDEDRTLPELGVGITNLADRPTRASSELTATELREGARALDALGAGYAPRLVAVVGVTAYRIAFGHPRASFGLQNERIGGRPVWVLPNPSGLNAHVQVPELAAAYREAWAYARDAGESPGMPGTYPGHDHRE